MDDWGKPPGSDMPGVRWWELGAGGIIYIGGLVGAVTIFNPGDAIGLKSAGGAFLAVVFVYTAIFATVAIAIARSRRKF